MASIRHYTNKRGDVTYQIIVSAGSDRIGRQIRHYKTWKPPATMGARDIARELQRIATEFEQDILGGFQIDNKQTFAEYAEYCYSLRVQAGEKPQTLERVKRQTARINEYIGNLQLNKITPRNLNEMYKSFAKPGANRWQIYAVPAADFVEMQGDMTCKEFAEKCGVYDRLIWKLRRGQQITRQNAAIIEKNLGKKGLFTIKGSNKPLSPATIRDYHAVVSSVFDRAYKEMIIKYNPAERVVLPKMRRVREQKALEPQELQAVLTALEAEPLQFKTMITLFIVTGCRRGEILALTWDKINYEKAEILIDASMNYVPHVGIFEGTTKTENKRRVAIPPEMVTLLKRYRIEQAERKLMLGDMWGSAGNRNLVFPKWDGNPLNPGNVNVMLTEFCKRHNLPHINPHLFRHTAASLLISNGVDVLTVSKMLGHSDMSTTMETYAHALEDARHKTAECFELVLLQDKRA